MILTASPQSLVSLDVQPTSQASIQARVVDVAGNPVKGQTVTFTQGAESFPGAPSGSYKETAVSQVVPEALPYPYRPTATGLRPCSSSPARLLRTTQIPSIITQLPPAQEP